MSFDPEPGLQGATQAKSPAMVKVTLWTTVRLVVIAIDPFGMTTCSCLFRFPACVASPAADRSVIRQSMKAQAHVWQIPAATAGLPGASWFGSADLRIDLDAPALSLPSIASPART